MKKLFPWIGGAVVGALLTGIAAATIAFISAFTNQHDPTYELVAVSWD